MHNHKHVMPVRTPMTLLRPPLARTYALLYLARRVDEEFEKGVIEGRIPLPVHLSIGQEAVSVGACLALKPKDVVFGTYRGHALYVAKGGNLEAMFAELYGKATGSAKGKGGSMHLIDHEAGIMGTSAIVGTGIANATGYALAVQYKKKKSVVVNFFGDGATEEGVFHESLNFAALKKLPIIYICENNGYAISSSQSVRQPKTSIAVRSKSYGIPTKSVAGNDLFAIYREVKKARAEIIRTGSGPRFIECATYRWRQHLGAGEDFGPGGRDKREAEPWMRGDQVVRIGRLIASSIKQKIEADVERKIKAARLFAEKSLYPAPNELWQDVFATKII